MPQPGAVSVVQPTDMVDLLDTASGSAKRCVLATDTVDLLDAASGLIHRCLENCFIQVIRNRHGIDACDVRDEFRKLLVKIIGEQQDITDTAALTLFIVAQLVERLVSDTIDVADGFRRMQGMGHGDTQGMTEAFNKMQNKRLDDRGEIADNLTRLMNKRIAEQQDIVDNAVRIIIRFLLATDRQDVRDAFIKMLAKQLGDLGMIEDNRSSSMFKSIGDRQDARDNATRLLSKLLNDRQDVTDTAALIRVLAALFSDSVDIRDVFAKALTKRVGDLGVLADNRSSMLSKSIGDVQDVSDAVIVELLRAVIRLAIADTLDLSDAQRKSLFKIIGDVDAIRDEFGKLLSTRYSDQQLTADNTAFSRQLTRELIEQQLVTDTAATIIQRVLVAADQIGIGDQFRKTLSKVLGDLGSVADASASMLSKVIGDRQDVSDTVITTAIVGLIVRIVADTLDLSDAQRKALFKNVGDLDAVFDNESMALNKSLADRQDVADTANRARQVMRSFLDDVATSDRFAKVLIKLLADDEAVADAFAKAWTKRLGDDADLRDEMASAFSKTIGESQAARDLFVKAINKTIDERQDFTDDALLVRYLRRLFTDDVILNDAAATTKITNQLFLEVIEAQDVSDDLIKKLFKVLAENIDVADAANIVIILAVPLARQFIESMVAGSNDQGKEWGAKAGINMATGTDSDKIADGAKAGINMLVSDDEPFDQSTGAKGRRLK